MVVLEELEVMVEHLAAKKKELARFSNNVLPQCHV